MATEPATRPGAGDATAQAYRRFADQGPWDAIVIGSGIGGLACAALLGTHAGRRVLVLERHYTAGGFTHTFKRPGFEWDVGVHYLGGMAPGMTLRRLFDELTGGRLDWADMGEVYDRIVIGDFRFDYPKGRRNLAAALAAAFPEEQAAIDGYFRAVRAAGKTARSFFAEKALPRPLAAVIGGLMRRRYLRQAGRTTREVLERLTDNQRLIAVLTAQFGDYGLPPADSSFGIHAAVTSHYFDGGYYPVGGAGRIAETIIPTIAAAGGAVVISAAVREVIVEHGRAVGVVMEDGRTFRAPMVISDAGVANTMGQLIPSSARDRLAAPLEGLAPSAAHLCLYLGVEGGPSDLRLPKANYWIYPHERFEQAIADFFADPAAPLPLVYLSFPAAKDPSFEARFPGRSTIEAITLAPWRWFERWTTTRWQKRGEEYAGLKASLATRLQAVVEQYVPAVRGRVRHAELSTPLTTAHFAGYRHGEIYGVDHTPARFRSRMLRPRTPIPGLWLTGQDISTCGVAGALIGGILTASAVSGRNLLGAILARDRASR